MRLGLWGDGGPVGEPPPPPVPPHFLQTFLRLPHHGLQRLSESELGTTCIVSLYQANLVSCRLSCLVVLPVSSTVIVIDLPLDALAGRRVVGPRCPSRAPACRSTQFLSTSCASVTLSSSPSPVFSFVFLRLYTLLEHLMHFLLLIYVGARLPAI